MKIAISLLNFRQGRVGGVETYIRQLIKHLAGCHGDDEIVLVTHQGNKGAIAESSIEQVTTRIGGQQVILLRILEAFTSYRASCIEKLFDELKPDAVLFP